MRTLTKKILFLLLIILVIMPNLTACGTSLTMYAQTDLPAALKARAAANKEIADDLLAAGLISADSHTKLHEVISNNTNTLLEGILDKKWKNIEIEDASKAMNTLAKAVTWYKLYLPFKVSYTDDKGVEQTMLVELEDPKASYLDTKYVTLGDVNPDETNPSNLNYSYFVISNYIAREHLKVGNFEGEKIDGKACVYVRDSFPTALGRYDYPGHQGKYIDYETYWSNIGVSGVEPIKFFTKDVEDDLEKSLSAPVMVLDTSKITASDKSLVKVIAEIKSAVDSGDITKLDNYFTELKDADNNVVKLAKQEDIDNIIGVSKQHSTIGWNTGSANRVVNKPGEDMIITQMLDGVERNVLSIRFEEFNLDAVNKLKDKIGLNRGQYYITTATDGNLKAYMFEYPVSVINSFEKITIDNIEHVKANLTNNSGLGINIRTGEIIKYDSDGNGKYKASGTAIPGNESYLTTGDFSNSDSNISSSFVAKGVSFYNINIGGKPISVLGPQIILRDYLEATWAPGSTTYTEEPVVVFGRKIRFFTGENYWTSDGEIKTSDNTKYDKYTLAYKLNDTDNVASFVDKDGAEIVMLDRNGDKLDPAYRLKITDFCDINSLLGLTNSDIIFTDDFGSRISGKDVGTNGNWDKYIVKYLATNNIYKGFIQNEILQTETSPAIDELSVNTDVTSIRVAKLFPGEYIGKIDKDKAEVKVERFYCVATTRGLFESALYTDWINSTSTTASLEWWNNYLGTKGYDYYIGHDIVNEYLQNNYSYELSQSGVIILDLETISKIQEIFDKEAGFERNSLIRTFFIVIGICILSYTMILMLCWVIDTHADIGVSLLNKATLGNWTAISSEDDIPTHTHGDRQYITSGKLLKNSLWMIALAIVCIRVNIIDVVLRIISFVGPLVGYIQNMIAGR